MKTKIEVLKHANHTYKSEVERLKLHNEKLYLVKNLAERLVIEKNMFSETLEELKKALKEF